MYTFIAVNMRLEYFPVVDTGFPRSPGVSQHKARLDLFRNDRHCLAMNAVCIKANRAHPSVERRVIILASRGYRDDLRLDVLRDHPHLLKRQVAIREAG